MSRFVTLAWGSLLLTMTCGATVVATLVATNTLDAPSRHGAARHRRVSSAGPMTVPRTPAPTKTDIGIPLAFDDSAHDGIVATSPVRPLAVVGRGVLAVAVPPIRVAPVLPTPVPDPPVIAPVPDPPVTPPSTDPTPPTAPEPTDPPSDAGCLLRVRRLRCTPLRVIVDRCGRERSGGSDGRYDWRWPT